MNAFTLSPQFNKNKVFILHKSELDKRLDPFCYLPELVELERKVLARKPKKLRDYVLSLSSGATPKTTESERYYTDAESGIPFLRVQNLSPTGVLEFEDCKFINKETHNGMLKRSQIFEDDLLIKITGVGRMAVASIAPEGFEGNINQHIVVIRTKDKTTSETIAAFLNSDIGEKLATRRSTGGTRPALDYPALLSIPIIYDHKILAITQKVVEQKKQNEVKAQQLLAGIDNYLLKELEIEMPDFSKKDLKKRIFTVSFKTVTGDRYNPFYHSLNYEQFINNLNNAKYPTNKLKEVIYFLDYGLMPTQDYELDEEKGIPMIRVTNIKPDGTIDMTDTKRIKEDTPKLFDKLVQENDILMVQCGNTTGKCAIVTKEYVGFTYGSFSFAIRSNPKKVLQNYLFYILNSSVVQKQLERKITITSVRPNTSKPDVLNFLIPVPPLSKQKEIADHITDIRKQAQQLKDKTKAALEQASKEIEEILLGS